MSFRKLIGQVAWTHFMVGFFAVAMVVVFGIPAGAQSALQALEAESEDMKVELQNITRVEGVRENQLRGYGIVTGLNGTGDGQLSFLNRSIANSLSELGISVDNPQQATLENIAAVLITAKLEPFKSKGDKIDVTVSSVGSAEDLAGGVLMQSPLKGANGKVYAVAQGALTKGGDDEDRHPTTVRIPQGALVERELPFEFVEDDDQFSLSLKRSNFTTSTRIANQINERLNREVAQPQDGGRVKVNIPEEFRENPVEYISMIQNFEVAPKKESRVVVNERTGTVLMGSDVQVRSVSISHDDIQLEVDNGDDAEANGETVVLPESTSINQVVDSLNAVGASTETVVAILEAMDEGDALSAPLVVM